ncbi:MAG: metallophosphoesterase [Thermoplasmata archaeon]
MRIAASGDIHYKDFLEKFAKELENLPDVDIFLSAGDLTEKSDLEGYGSVLETVRSSVDCPIVGVFGNEEYSQDRPKYRERFDMIFLEEESELLNIRGRRVRIIGSTGSLDRPTWWQRTNIPQIWRDYAERVKRIDNLLEGDELTILLMHYAPTYGTLKGEKEKYFPEMGSTKYEDIILKRCPEIVIHGHAHKGTKFFLLTKKQTSLEDFGVDLPSVPVYNVAFPIEEKITVIEL